MTEVRAPATPEGLWEAVYQESDPVRLSWYQREPVVSLELIETLGMPRDAAAVDIGGGTSPLVDRLLARGFHDISVLDISATALSLAQARLAGTANAVAWLHEEILRWQPTRRYDLWHDRALFHFLVGDEERSRYLEQLRAGTTAGGLVIIATFAPDGPERCSGLPVCRYGSDDLTLLLGNRFELVATRREEHHTPWGATQPFTWVAMRAVAEGTIPAAPSPGGDR